MPTADEGLREYGLSSGKRSWLVQGAADESTALSFIIDGGTPLAPITWGSLRRSNAVATEKRGQDAWEVNVDYAKPGVIIFDQEVGEAATVQGDVQTVTEKAFFAYEETRYGWEAPDMFGAILPDQSGPAMPVRGTDVQKGVLIFSYSAKLASASVNAAYLETLVELANGYVNDDAFMGFATGTLRFDGAQFTRDANGDYAFVWRFAASVSKVVSMQLDTDPEGSPDPTDVTVEPWHFVWTYNKPVVVSVGTIGQKLQFSRPRFAYVDRVYEYADFALLAIPT